MTRITAGRRAFLCLVLAGGSSACQPAKPAGSAPAEAGVAVDGTGKTLAELFEGKFAGVAVTAVPGGVKLRIRNAENPDGSAGHPLYVIDGLPINPPDGVLTISPNDVLRIEILKGDASTLIWGERGLNGVVKITTKRK
jgi:outer membrane receptor protein involved in Fe transport